MPNATPVYVIRELEWKESESGAWIAESGFGKYYVEQFMSGGRITEKWCWETDLDGTGRFCDSIASGKAACEAHWRERIAACLDLCDPHTLPRGLTARELLILTGAAISA